MQWLPKVPMVQGPVGVNTLKIMMKEIATLRGLCSQITCAIAATRMFVSGVQEKN